MTVVSALALAFCRSLVIAFWPPAASELPTALAAPPSLQSLAEPAGGTVGFAAVDLTSAKWIGLRVDHAFPTQRVFNLPVAIEVLHRVDAGHLRLDQVVEIEAGDARDSAARTLQVPGKRTIRELLEAMLIHSDSVACDKLLAIVGGPAAVDARMRGLGITGITIRYSELQMGSGNHDNTATPRAMVLLLRKIAHGKAGVSPSSGSLLEDMLVRVTTGPGRIKGGLPPGTVVAHKTGTSRTTDGITTATNDVGLVTLPNGRRLAIAAFVQASQADESTREGVIAQLARAAYDRLGDASPAPAAAERVESLASYPKVTLRFLPEYPDHAEAERLEGDVLLKVSVDETGSVAEATVIRSAGHGFDEAAVAAAYRMKFTPAISKAGRPVRCTIQYKFQFTIEEQPPWR